MKFKVQKNLTEESLKVGYDIYLYRNLNYSEIFLLIYDDYIQYIFYFSTNYYLLSKQTHVPNFIEKINY